METVAKIVENKRKAKKENAGQRLMRDKMKR